MKIDHGGFLFVLGEFFRFVDSHFNIGDLLIVDLVLMRIFRTENSNEDFTFKRQCECRF